VESEPEKGSTFSFEIPFISAENNDYKNMSIHVDYIPGLLNGKNILVVDDDPLVPEILKPLFEAERINVVFYQDPLSALEIVYKQPFDVVFVDLHMPNLNGLDMLNKIRNDEKSQNKTTYTILCTANVIKNFEILPNKRIPDCVLYKPYRRRDILNTLYKIFNVDTIGQHPKNNQKDQEMADDYTLKNFKEFAGNDISLLDNFITLFISESEGELGKLDSYLANQNYKQIGEVAHMFKNTYGQLEAKEELSIIKQLEGLVKDNDISEDEIKRLITELQGKSKILFVKLQKEMESLKN
jgi:CheY-like chemotaxis protein